MKVSVIVPIHNTHDYLPKCIESILNQTHRDIEIILINDDSTDNCADICKTYQIHDERIVFETVCEHNAGGARNRGLSIASGELIAFIDSDDWVEPNYIKLMHDCLIEQNADLVMCESFFEYADGRVVEKTPKLNAFINSQSMRNGILVPLKKNADWYPTFYLWDKLFRKSLWINVKFDTSLRNAEDRLALYEIFSKDVTTYLIKKPLYHYRVGIGVSNRNKNNTQENNYRATKKILDISKLNNLETLPIYESLSIHTFGLFRRLANDGNLKEALALANSFKPIYPNINWGGRLEKSELAHYQ